MGTPKLEGFEGVEEIEGSLEGAFIFVVINEKSLRLLPLPSSPSG
jgi:hypothetical protein